MILLLLRFAALLLFKETTDFALTGRYATARGTVVGLDDGVVGAALGQHRSQRGYDTEYDKGH